MLCFSLFCTHDWLRLYTPRCPLFICYIHTPYALRTICFLIYASLACNCGAYLKHCGIAQCIVTGGQFENMQLSLRASATPDRGRANRRPTMREYHRERHSRSRSPNHTRRHDLTLRPRRVSPPTHSSPRKPSARYQVFREGASSQSRATCAICLGNGPHNVTKCSLDNFWDGTKARCRRNEDGRIINPSGQTLCIDWQRPKGCTARDHDHRHECSGCGRQDHGAQHCPRAQKE
jgi:hypothetical protein